MYLDTWRRAALTLAFADNLVTRRHLRPTSLHLPLSRARLACCDAIFSNSNSDPKHERSATVRSHTNYHLKSDSGTDRNSNECVEAIKRRKKESRIRASDRTSDRGTRRRRSADQATERARRSNRTLRLALSVAQSAERGYSGSRVPRSTACVVLTSFFPRDPRRRVVALLAHERRRTAAMHLVHRRRSSLRL